MSECITRVDPDDSSRLSEIGQLTALAYLADGLVDQAHPYIPQLKDARTRAHDADLLIMADGVDGQGSVIGTITVVPPGSSLAELAGPDEYELRMLAVSPLERGRGIGANLTRAAMERAVNNGAHRIVLSTMESMHVAHRLYEKLGFERREDLDWTVIDNADGSITRVTSADAGDTVDGHLAIRLLGYSWEPPRP
ncbi:GNAT family N-acetyltransferase [Demequina sp. B12]|uniref:GNAT family N-acetyltransferase n=1 Tax=Demequina sp. B12 TaxID=2992757 RepID=UPI00237B0B0A|nr:GNAT family N-acetyltransferase [Demequina sp. B12]MDE0572667.1 GNAT family N-acetyltransferase [Demequina sp. B12]